MNKVLQAFYNNPSEREVVKSFLIETLGVMAIEKAFAGEDTSGIKEASECIHKSFDKLRELYGKVEEKEIPNSR